MPTVYKFFSNPSDKVWESIKKQKEDYDERYQCWLDSDEVVMEMPFGGDLTLDEMYPLMAFTSDKNLKNLFMSTRNMKHYIMTKTKMTSDEYIKFGNRYRGSCLELIEYDYFERKYPSKTNGQDKKVVGVKVLSTRNEYEIVEAYADDMGTGIESDIGSYIFPFAFKDKYIKALNTLAYAKTWQFTQNDGGNYNHLIPDKYYDDIVDYNFPDIQYSKFDIFIYLNSSVLDIK